MEFSVKTRIFTASVPDVRRRLRAAGLDPDDYAIGPYPSEWHDGNLDELIERDNPAPQPEPVAEPLDEYLEKIRQQQFGGCGGCGSDERVHY